MPNNPKFSFASGVDLEETFSGPATFCNITMLGAVPPGCRMSFCERISDTSPVIFRTAVFMAWGDIAQLHAALGQMLEQVTRQQGGGKV